jgi:hypothetical protein
MSFAEQQNLISSASYLSVLTERTPGQIKLDQTVDELNEMMNSRVWVEGNNAKLMEKL